MTGELAGPTVVHLGLGNFHRAHQAVYTANAAPDWSIVGVAPRSTEIVQALRRQRHAYHVLTLGPGRADASRISVHRDSLTARTEPERLRDWIADSHTRVVTLTVTERGYSYQSDGNLDLSAPDVEADVKGIGRRGHQPRTVLGHLVAGLWARAEAAAGPLSVVSCDNLAGNGPLTARVVRQMAAALEAPFADDLTRWITASVSFPSTMVDRMVPATTARHRSLVQQLTGVTDAVPVVAEPFTMWVLEDHFLGGRPPWELDGAVFSAEVAAFEDMKLSLLNGTHSLVACLGLLRGHATIAEAVRDELVSDVAFAYMTDEVLPHIHLPEDVDARAYVQSLLERFANPELGHTCRQVASEGSTKLPQRLAPVMTRAMAGGTCPTYSALTVAAWLAVVLDARYDDVVEMDRAAVRASARACPSDPIRHYVEGGPFGRLADGDRVVGHVAEMQAAISRSGISSVLASTTT